MATSGGEPGSRYLFEGAVVDMTNKPYLYLIDSASRRRAAITSQFASLNLHIEPCESVSEYVTWSQGDGIIFVHDEPGVLTELTMEMAKTGKWGAIICFAEVPTPNQIVKSVKYGARDYLTLPLQESDIRAAITTGLDSMVLEGSAWLSRSKAQSQIERLSKREREVLKGVADGLSNRLIAENLAISHRTVEIHRANMLSKLGARSSSEAIRLSVQAFG